MGLMEWIRSKMKAGTSNCPVSEKTPETLDLKTRRRAATIRGRVNNTDEQNLEQYLDNYTPDKTYGEADGELTGKTIKALARALFKAGEDSKTIISGLPKYSEEESEYEECRSYSDEPEYTAVGGPDSTTTPAQIEKAALEIIDGMNKLLESGINDDAIHTSILQELKPLGYDYAKIADLAGTIKPQHDDLINKLELFKSLRGGKRARRVRRTKRTKGKSRGRAGKATRVRRNNNNSNKTKRNKGKKRRTKRA